MSTEKKADGAHVAGVFIRTEDHVIWAFLLFTSVTVPKALNCELMHRKGKPYHLFSHIFRLEFAKYNRIPRSPVDGN